jgi:hypothetical protein
MNEPINALKEDRLMPDNVVNALIFLGVGLFWLLLTIFPHPLIFVWRTMQGSLEAELDPQATIDLNLDERNTRRLRLATLTVAVLFFLVAAFDYFR